jgi:hypothetical protein
MTMLKDAMTELLRHSSHKVEIAYYGEKDNPVSVTLECMDCSCILLHLREDKDGEIEIGDMDEDVD